MRTFLSTVIVFAGLLTVIADGPIVNVLPGTPGQTAVYVSSKTLGPGSGGAATNVILTGQVTKAGGSTTTVINPGAIGSTNMAAQSIDATNMINNLDTNVFSAGGIAHLLQLVSKWSQDVNGNGFSLTNANKISASGFTNSSATANTMAYWDVNKAATSLANGGANTVAHGTSPPTETAVVEADFGFTDLATANSATTQHGLLKKLDNNAAHFMDGTGNWSTPAGGGGGSATNSVNQIFTNGVSVTAAVTTNLNFNQSANITVPATNGNGTVGITPTLSANLTGMATITGTNGAVQQFGGNPPGTIWQLSNNITSGATVSIITNGVIQSTNPATGATFRTPTNQPAANQVLLFTSSSGDSAASTVPNAALANSSVTLNGTANQVTVAGGGPLALGGTATLSLPNPLITPGPISVTGDTNSHTSANQMEGTDASNGQISQTMSAWIDAQIGSTRGAILTRGASVWGALAPGASGTFLGANGAGADLTYGTPVSTGAAIYNSGTNVTLDAATTNMDFWPTGPGGANFAPVYPFATNRAHHLDYAWATPNPTNNDTAVSNGVVALKTVTTISIPLAAWYTNADVVTPNSPATPIALTNMSSGWLFANGASNEIHYACSMPGGWDGSAIRVRTRMACLGTNDVSATNGVYRVGAYCLAPQTSLSNNLAFTFVWCTNNCPSGTLNGMAVGTGSVTTDLTPAGTLAATNTMLLSIRRDAGNVVREATNSVCLVNDVIIYCNVTNLLAMPTPTP